MINLLPHASKTISIQQYVIFSTNMFLIGLLVVMGLATPYFHARVKQLVSETRSKESAVKQIKKSVEAANSSLLDLAYINDRKVAYKTLKADDRDYTELLDKMAAATPEKLKITTIGIGTNKDTNSLVGTAANRNEVATFIDNLNKTDLFTKVTLTDANGQTDGINFTITFELPGSKIEPSPSPSAGGEL